MTTRTANKIRRLTVEAITRDRTLAETQEAAQAALPKRSTEEERAEVAKLVAEHYDAHFGWRSEPSLFRVLEALRSPAAPDRWRQAARPIVAAAGIDPDDSEAIRAKLEDLAWESVCS